VTYLKYNVENLEYVYVCNYCNHYWLRG
jgi:hypothetical protein